MGSRYGERESDVRPGDWKCYDCKANNFARRQECFKCQAPKSGGSGGGDSYDDGYSNRGYGGGYNDRRAPRNRSRSPPRGRSYGGRDSYNGGNGGGEWREGDWECYKCGFSNFARRDECFKCNHSKSGGNSGSRDRGYGGARDGARSYGGGRGGGRGGDRSYNGGGRNDDVRAGDWMCPKEECAVNNFARRAECFKCGEPK